MGDRRLAALKPAAPDPAALFAQVVSAPRLEAAWAKVRANDGAAGGDGVSVRAFEGDSARRLGRLAEALATGEYRPGPIRHVEIPKPQGGMRGLSIPCVVDRVAQTSAHEVLGPILDAEFEDTSFAYRPGRGVADAVRRVAALREEGYAWLLDADIEAFFDNVPHERLIDRLGESLPDGPLTNLISLWITHAAPSGRGLPQGSPISPLLANLYLDRADEALQGKGHRLVRFADDFVILAKDQGGAEAALALAGRVLGDLGLRLNAEKTKVTSFDQGFRFLGHLFVRSLVMKTGPVESDMARVEADLAAIARSDQTRAAKARKAEAEEETRSAAGLAAAFRVLYLRSPDRRLGLRNTAFSVQEGAGVGGAVEWREILAIPHQDVDRIEIYPDAQILPEALRHALARDTQVAFVSGRGETLGVASSDVTGHGARHLAHCETSGRCCGAWAATRPTTPRPGVGTSPPWRV
jgi:CRISPR-associated protein Cas1